MIFRRFLIGAATLALAGSLALAGEGPDLEVRAGLGLGIVEKATCSLETMDIIEYQGISLLASVEIARKFASGWSAEVRFQGVMGFDDEDAEIGGIDGEADLDEFAAGALAGYTFRAGDSFAVTPQAGLSWRSWSVDGQDDFSGWDISFSAGALALDLGARAELRLGERLGLTASVLFGLPLTGSNHYRTLFGTVDADFDGGYFLEAGAGVEYRLSESLALTAGLGYATASIDWEWDDFMGLDGEDELSRFTVQFGAAVRF